MDCYKQTFNDYIKNLKLKEVLDEIAKGDWKNL